MEKIFKTIVGFIFFVFLVALVGRLFFFELATTNSYSMVPLLVPGDMFIVSTVGEIELGDVAVCKNPEDPSTMVVGRVLAMPGSTFSIRHDIPYIDGQAKDRLNSDDLVYEDNTSGEHLQYLTSVSREYVGGHNYLVAHMERAGDKNFPETEIHDGFFLVGDNRNRAYDSRRFGVVAAEECMGKGIFILWPGEDSGDLKWSERFFEWLI